MTHAVRLLCVGLPAALVGSTSGYAVTYLTLEQAQAVLCPGAKLQPVDIVLTSNERKAIMRASGVRVREGRLRGWHDDASGVWFLVDQVIGKHEYITYALAITSEGAVAGLEIMDYRETYGGEVRDKKWRAQFDRKTAASPLRLDEDIKNITGATLSCRNVTDGVKRLLATHSIVLANRP